MDFLFDNPGVVVFLLGLTLTPIIVFILFVIFVFNIKRRVDKLEQTVYANCQEKQLGWQAGGTGERLGTSAVGAELTGTGEQPSRDIPQEVETANAAAVAHSGEAVAPRAALAQEHAEVRKERADIEAAWNGADRLRRVQNAAVTARSGKDTAGGGVEKFFLGSLFNKVGALLILIFVILFVKWAAPYVFVTEWSKVIALYFLSGLFVGTGAYLYSKDNMRALAEVSIGLGFATALIDTFAGSVFFEVWNNYVSLVLASFLLVVMYVLAFYMQRFSVLALSMLAGYSNLIFICSVLDKSSFINSVYLPLLVLLCFIGAWRCRAWHSLASLNLFICWVFSAGLHSDGAFSIWASAAMWAVCLVYDALREGEIRIDELRSKPANPLSIYFNHLLMCLGGVLLYVPNDRISFFAISILAAVVLLGLALARFEVAANLAKAFINTALCITAISALILSTGLAGLIFLAVTGSIVMYVAIFKVTNAELSRKLSTCSIIYSFLMTAMVFWNFAKGELIFFASSEFVFSQMAVVLFAFTIAVWVAEYFVFRVCRPEEKGLSEVALWAAVALAFIYFDLELIQLLEKVLYNAFDTHKAESIITMSRITLAAIYGLVTAMRYKAFPSKLFLASGVLVLGYSSLVLCSYAVIGRKLFIPVFNVGFIAYTITILAVVVYYLAFRSKFALVVSLLLGWALLHTEGGNFVRVCGLESITSILWALYAAVALFVGISKKNSPVTWTGIFIACVTVVRVMLYDISELPTGYKLISCLVLGTSLMAISYYYHKRKESLLPMLTESPAPGPADLSGVANSASSPGVAGPYVGSNSGIVDSAVGSVAQVGNSSANSDHGYSASAAPFTEAAAQVAENAESAATSATSEATPASIPTRTAVSTPFADALSDMSSDVKSSSAEGASAGSAPSTPSSSGQSSALNQNSPSVAPVPSWGSGAAVENNSVAPKTVAPPVFFNPFSDNN